MTEYRDLTVDDIEALAVGAWILGTGGGGSPYLGLLNMRQLYAEGKRVTLMSPEALADDDPVAVVSNQGAPLVGQERLTDSANIARAVMLMEEFTGTRFRAIMALEIGGGNSIQPLMAAAHLDRPVVDADCMGRAYPEAQMTSFAVGDLRPQSNKLGALIPVNLASRLSDGPVVRSSFFVVFLYIENNTEQGQIVQHAARALRPFDRLDGCRRICRIRGALSFWPRS